MSNEKEESKSDLVNLAVLTSQRIIRTQNKKRGSNFKERETEY